MAKSATIILAFAISINLVQDFVKDCWMHEPVGGKIYFLPYLIVVLVPMVDEEESGRELAELIVR